MKHLLEDRRLLLPTILTALVIAIGATLIIVLAGDNTGGGGSASSSDGGSAPAASSGPAQGGSGEVVKVAISDFEFDPEALTVKAGTEVEWTNEDDAPHNAIGDGGVETKNLRKGDSQGVELGETGTFDYVCTLHPFMKATVTVE